jgi:hypothetical protein
MGGGGKKKSCPPGAGGWGIVFSGTALNLITSSLNGKWLGA